MKLSFYPALFVLLIMGACSKDHQEKDPAKKPLPAYYIRAYVAGRPVVFDQSAVAYRIDSDTGHVFLLNGTNTYIPDSLSNIQTEAIEVYCLVSDTTTYPAHFKMVFPSADEFSYYKNGMAYHRYLKTPSVNDVFITETFDLPDPRQGESSLDAYSDTVVTGTFSAGLIQVVGVPNGAGNEPTQIRIDSGTYRLPVVVK